MQLSLSPAMWYSHQTLQPPQWQLMKSVFYAMHSSLLTANTSSVFFTGINSLPEKYVSTCIFSSTCVCVVPQPRRRQTGARLHLRPCTVLLCPSTLRSCSGRQGGWGPATEMFCNTSCCAGSLGVASGCDLLSCLLEHNCSLLIFFFLSLWFRSTHILLRFLINLTIWGVWGNRELIICRLLLYIMKVSLCHVWFQSLFPLIRQSIRVSDCTSQVCVLGGEGRSRFCGAAPWRWGHISGFSLPNPPTSPPCSAQPCKCSMAGHVLPLAQPAGARLLESLRSGRTRLPGNGVLQMNPSLVIWRDQITSWTWPEL